MAIPQKPSIYNNFGSMTPAQLANQRDVAALSRVPISNTPAPMAAPAAPMVPPTGQTGGLSTNTPAPTPVPAPMAPAAPAMPNMGQLENDFKSYMTPGSDEVALATQIADLQGATQQGVIAKEGQGRGIPLELVRGQQGKLLQQGQVQQQTLQQKLAIMQAKRQTALEASKFALDRADKAAETARTVERETKADQAAQAKFALDNKITTPFYNVAGTIYRTSDRKAFSTPEEFFAAGGARDFSNAPNITGTKQPAVKFETVSIGTAKNPQKVRYGYDEQGNIVSAIDLATGKSIMSAPGVPGTPPVPVVKKTTPPPPPKTTLTQEHSLISQAFDAVKGNDQKVSANDWNKLADKFVSDRKGTYQDFYNKHKNWIGGDSGYKGAK